jgi:hypothetical protein
MRRIHLVLLQSLIPCIGLGLAATASSAEPERPAQPERPARRKFVVGQDPAPVFGQVVAATADSLTVAVKPPPAPRPRAKRGEAPAPAAAPVEPAPVEHVFTLSKDNTEFLFAQLRSEMPLADGTTFRRFEVDAPASAADLKPGVTVQVTAKDGAASKVIIPWGTPGVLERVARDSVTFRPRPANTEAADAALPEQTLKAGEGLTKVRFEVTEGPGLAAGGQVFQNVRYVRGGFADLKPGQHVVVCVKDGAALKIRVVEPEPGRQGAN